MDGQLECICSVSLGLSFPRERLLKEPRPMQSQSVTRVTGPYSKGLIPYRPRCFVLLRDIIINRCRLIVIGISLLWSYFFRGIDIWSLFNLSESALILGLGDHYNYSS